MHNITYRKIGIFSSLFLWAWFMSAGLCYSGPPIGHNERDMGQLEVDCNIAGIAVQLCPKHAYIQKEEKVFFGLIRSTKYVCSGQEILAGETPLKPTDVPAGRYILMIPSDYVWEGEGPIELTILPGEKTYFLLKLFSSSAHRPELDYGGGGGGGGGGGAR
jgi:hypothetical protein